MLEETHVMIDAETIGTEPGCCVLTVGAVAFDPRVPFPADPGSVPSVSLAVERASCAEFGLEEEPGSLAFWMAQPMEAFDAAFNAPDPLSLPVALTRLSAWFGSVAADPRTVRVWCHGATFDVPILSRAYRVTGIAPPWDFRMVRDTRTVYDIGRAAPDRGRGLHHEALNDAVVQARAVVDAYTNLGLRRDLPAAA